MRVHDLEQFVSLSYVRRNSSPVSRNRIILADERKTPAWTANHFPQVLEFAQSKYNALIAARDAYTHTETYGIIMCHTNRLTLYDLKDALNQVFPNDSFIPIPIDYPSTEAYFAQSKAVAQQLFAAPRSVAESPFFQATFNKLYHRIEDSVNGGNFGQAIEQFYTMCTLFRIEDLLSEDLVDAIREKNKRACYALLRDLRS